MDRTVVNPWTWQDQFDFSQAIAITGAHKTVYCAGQVSADTDGNPLHPGNMLAQFHCALDNLEQVLGHAGLRLADVVRLNYFATDVPAFLEAVPEIGIRLTAAGCKPASTLLGVSRLARPEFMIELEATAAV